jgi:hypothetical protein
MTIVGSPDAQSVPLPMRRSQRIQSPAPPIAGAVVNKPPERDSESQSSLSRAAWKQQLKGIKRDFERLNAQSGPNAKDQIIAVCRALNDCNKRSQLLRNVFAGTAGGEKLRQDLRDGIRLAMELANRHLQTGTASMLAPWPIRQLFNAVRGLIFCEPFAGTDLEPGFRRDLATLATSLLVALSDSPALGPVDDLPDEGGKALLPYPVILYGFYRMCEAELIDAPAHQKVLESLLDAVTGSRDAEGWNVQAISNACDALGWLVQDGRWRPAARSVHGAASTLALLASESLNNPYEVDAWKEADSRQTLRGLHQMLGAGVGISPTGKIDPAFAQALEDLEAPRLDREPSRLRAAETPQPMVQSVVSEPVPVTESFFSNRLLAPALPEETASLRPENAPGRSTPSISEVPRNILNQLNAKTSPKALIRLIDTHHVDITDALPQASAGDLSKWLSLIARTQRSSAVGDRAVRMLVAAVQQHVQTRSGLAIDELAPLMLVVRGMLHRFQACAPEVTAALKVLCQKLTETSGNAIRLGPACDAVRGMASLIVDGDVQAALALRHLTQLCKASGADFPEKEPELFDPLWQLLFVLAPVLDDPDVSAFLAQLVSRLANDKSPFKKSKVSRAYALAVVISHVPSTSANNGSLPALLNFLARGLQKPQIQVTSKAIGNARIQRQLVYSLLEPYATVRSPNFSFTIKDTLDDTLILKFIGGWLDGDQAEFALDTDTKYLVLGQAHFQWAVAEAQDISDTMPDAPKLFESVLDAIEDGGTWACKGDEVSSALTAICDAITQSYLPLWHLGPSAYWRIRKGLSKVHEERHATQLALLAAWADQGGYVPADEQAADLLTFIKAGTPEQWGDHPAPHQELVEQSTKAPARDANADQAVARETLPQGPNATAESNEHARKAAVQQVENFVRHTLKKPEHLKRLSEVVPWLGAAVQLETGRAAIQALVQRAGELAGKSKPSQLLEPKDALRLVADLACNALTATDVQASGAVSQLMETIARKCSKKPVTWVDKWWISQRLDTERGLGIFVFTVLQNAWKTQREGELVYRIPADATDHLTTVFIYGQAINDHGNPWMKVSASKANQLDLIAIARYQALQARRTRCKADNDRKKMIVPAIMTILTCVELPGQHHLLREAFVAFQEAVSAWGDPVALAESVPEQQRPTLLLVAQDAEDAPYRHADDRHNGPLAALVQHCKQLAETQDVT